MAVYKIFPEKDASIYSLFPNMNTGMDEMIEATETVFAYSDPNPQTSRFLIKFSEEDIKRSDLVKFIVTKLKNLSPALRV